MAGHLYIRNLSKAQLVALGKAGATLNHTIFHADVALNAVGTVRLVEQEAVGAANNRHGLPAHCYLHFDKNGTSQEKLRAIGALLLTLTNSSGIVSANKNLDPWPGADANATADKLWASLQLGAVTLEFSDGQKTFDPNAVYKK